MKKNLLHDVVILLVLLFIIAPVILPYFHAGYFPTHDGEWAVVRLSEMFREVKDLQIPPRYSGYLNFGYGYPLFNFAYPFPYYLGVFIHAFGFSFVETIKILFAFTVPLSAMFMYFAAKEIWHSRFSGFVSGLLYIYFPYRMIDLYVRGSLGESIAFVLYAAILFLLARLIKKPDSYGTMLIASILYAALILTHNIMAVFFTIMLAAIIGGLIIIKNFRSVKSVIIFILSGILLSCFFWLPALYEKQYIVLSEIPIADRALYFVTLRQLFIPSWGYAPPTEPGGFSYQLGIAQSFILLLLILIIGYTISKGKKAVDDTKAKIALFILGLVAFFIFLLFPASGFLWKLPLIKEINYPWTLLGPIGFLLSLVAGFFCIQRKFVVGTTVIVALAAILFVFPYAKPERYVDRGDAFYYTNDATTTSSQELMPLWVREKPQKSAEEKVVVLGSGNARQIVASSKNTSFLVNVQGDTVVRVNTIYYPGWVARVDGVEQHITYDNPGGVMEIAVPDGEHLVDVQFRETPLRLASNIVSIASMVIIGTILFIQLAKPLIKRRSK